MFDAISNYIEFLTQELENTEDREEREEIIRILRTAKKVRQKFLRAS